MHGQAIAALQRGRHALLRGERLAQRLPTVVDAAALSLFALSQRGGKGRPGAALASTSAQRFRNMTKAMDSVRWQGANHSNARRHCEDLQRGDRTEGALSCSEISVAAYSTGTSGESRWRATGLKGFCAPCQRWRRGLGDRSATDRHDPL